jgi:hypothetical protein
MARPSSPTRSSASLLLAVDTAVNNADPPPPYPSRERRARAARAGRRHGQNTSSQVQVSSTESDPDALTATHPFPLTEGPDANVDVSETAPLLSPLAARRRTTGRTRTHSIASTLLSSVSAAPSIAQTMISLFQTEPDSDPDCSDHENEGRPLLPVEDHDGARRQGLQICGQRRRSSWLSRRAWKRYFRPMTLRTYYAALFHLLVLNFPYALAAWVYLFVFTLVRIIYLWYHSICPSSLHITCVV